MVNMATSPYEQIFSTRHPLLKEKDANERTSVWRLIYNSYLGGLTYRNGGYLSKYPKESEDSFKIRRERSVYFNQVSPIVDMLSGMLFTPKPIRNQVPKEMGYLTDHATRKKSMDTFMRLVSAYSLMFTCGVLVDSPDFNTDEVKTRADREKKKLNPYASLYLPFEIRDFHLGDDGELEWIILDDSYYDHSDPMIAGVVVERYRLWRRTSYQDFIRGKDDKNILAGPEVPHNIGEVPFRLVSWRDDDGDAIGETIFEDIAYISKLIYNSMSYMDEMLASGTFKMLAYPSEDGTLPKEIVEGGLGPLGGIPFMKDSAHAPDFIGADLQNIDGFIKAINFYMAEVLKKIGASTDETKEFVKSGKAKKVDLEKMQALLISGSQMMSDAENWIYRIAAKWEGKTIEPKVKYTTDFSNEQLREEIDMLTSLLIHPVKSMRREILKVMNKKLLANYIEADKVDEIESEIDRIITSESPKIIRDKDLEIESNPNISTPNSVPVNSVDII